jgi:hypothetical protein
VDGPKIESRFAVAPNANGRFVAWEDMPTRILEVFIRK